MLPLILAMVTLTTADPDPVSTPAASLSQRLSGSIDTSTPFVRTNTSNVPAMSLAACNANSLRQSTYHPFEDSMTVGQAATTSQCPLDAFAGTTGQLGLATSPVLFSAPQMMLPVMLPTSIVPRPAFAPLAAPVFMSAPAPALNHSTPAAPRAGGKSH